jgi:nicotinic acid mononucleotide adenylyltransferase
MDSHTNNIVVFTIGRMNPPTPGHMLLIEKLILRALSLGQTKIGIIVSHSQDIPKNPLYCAEKRDAILPAMIRALKEQMKTRMPHVSPESIDGIEPIIICMDEIPNLENPPKSMLIRSVVKLLELYNYREIPIKKMHLIIGQDRASQYGFIQETLFDMSDQYQINVCETCGNIVSSATACRMCKTGQINRTNIPYCAKLLFQELEAMGINIQINTKEDKKEEKKKGK